MKKIFISLIIVICLTIPFSNVLALDLADGVQILANCEVVDGELNEWLKNAFKFVQYVGIAIAFVLTAMDFIQVIGGSKDDDLKNAFNRAMKRVIAVILLLLTTVIVSFVIDIINPVIDTEIPNCVEGI